MENEQFNRLMTEIKATNEKMDNNFDELKREIKATNEKMDNNFNELKRDIKEVNAKVDNNFNELKRDIKEINAKVDNNFNELKDTRLELSNRIFSLEMELKTEIKDQREINSREHSMFIEEFENDIQTGKREREEMNKILIALSELSRLNNDKHKEYDRILNL